MQITVASTDVSISGAVSSAAHEGILKRTAALAFPEAGLRIDLQPGEQLPPGWALTTELTLKAMALAYSGQADIRADSIRIRGITTEPERWQAAVTRLEQHLLPGMQLDQEVLRLRQGVSHEESCRRQFSVALQDRRIDFATSSAEIGTASLPVLDSLLQIAVDCPAAVMRITGHTDDSGVAAANKNLSEARARTVATYMIERGIPAERIVAVGKGASQPLAPNDSAANRQRNRRIEISVSFR